MSADLTKLDLPEFERIRRMLVMSAGIFFDEKRREVLRLHLRERAQARACSSFEEYADLLEAPGNADELQALWNKVAIHQTSFFRNRPQFEGLQRRVLPEIVASAAARAAAQGSGRRLLVWSAGCSSGEEPYSLAISLLEALGADRQRWDLTVLATDLSTEIVRKAKAARYGARQIEDMPAGIRDKYFVRDSHGFYSPVPEVREIVDFSLHNLAVEGVPFLGGERADLIFCCNVTIYFAKEALLHAIRVLEESLRPGGYLFLGHSESLWRQPHGLELIDIGNSFAYRRPVGGMDDLALAGDVDRLPAVTAPPRRSPRQPARPTAPAMPIPASPSPPVKAPEPFEPLAPSVQPFVAPEPPVLSPAAQPAAEAPPPALPPDATAPAAARRPPEAAPPGAAREAIGAQPFIAVPSGSGDGMTSLREDAAAGAAYLDEGKGPLSHAEILEVVATSQGHLERGEIDEAATLLERALRREPTDAALNFLLGSAYQRLGRNSAAQASFGKTIYCDPEFSLAYFYRAVLYEEDGELRLARKEYGSAVRHFERDPAGKWDPYLESMGHEALLGICRTKLEALSDA